MRSCRTAALVTAVIVSALAAPAAARAAIVSAENSQFRLTAANGEANALTIDYTITPGSELGSSEYVISVTDQGGSLLTAGPGCTATGAVGVCRSNAMYLRSLVDLGDGDDRLETTLAWGRIDAGPGDDVVQVLNNSMLEIDGGIGADKITGGIPTFQGRTQPVTVTLDDDAPDGAAGEGDDIRGAFALIGGSAGDALTASPLRSRYLYGTFVYGGPGADALTGTQAPDLLVGNEGDDDIQGLGGDDALYGDSHEMYLDHDDAPLLRIHPFAAGGNDVLVGGPGSDWLHADEGDDVFQLRDGERDGASCGIGTDLVYLDHVDEVVGSDCEKVKRR